MEIIKFLPAIITLAVLIIAAVFFYQKSKQDLKK
jgi:hypothetical protein